MDVGKAAGVASIAASTRQADIQRSLGRSGSDQNNTLQQPLNGDKGSGTLKNTSQSTSTDYAVAPRERRQDERKNEERSSESQLIDEALSLLNKLMEIDPRQSLPRRQQREEESPAEESGGDVEHNVDELSFDDDPGQLFDLFARQLRSNTEQLALYKNAIDAVDGETVEGLRNLVPHVAQAGAWWRKKVKVKGVAECQLQELKHYTDWLAERGGGLRILLQMAHSQDRAIRNLVAELDVLQKIVFRTLIHEMPGVRSPELSEIAKKLQKTMPNPAFVKRRGQAASNKLSIHTSANKEFEQSAQLIRHLGQQLLGDNAYGMSDMEVANHQVGSEKNEEQVEKDLGQLRAQLSLFSPGFDCEKGDIHLEAFVAMISHIQKINDWNHLPSALAKSWQNLEAMATILMIRLKSADSWVDSASLRAIADDLKEALDHALDGIRQRKLLNINVARRV